MRKGIDFIGVGTGAVIVDSRGHVFLSKRGNKAQNERHTWEFPGGSVEFGETLSHALWREIFEDLTIASQKSLESYKKYHLMFLLLNK